MKISMVMPIYNEAKLLPYHLALAAPFVDEIVLIDGSPTGPSTDGSADLIEYGNVTCIEGTFEMANRKDGWDKGGQITKGIENASGDMIILTSCDSIYDDYELLCQTIKEHPEGKVFYCFVTEFFKDMAHIRLMYDAEYPRPQVGYGIFPKVLFTTQENAYFARNLVEAHDYVFLQDLRKFHYGWMTDFDKQVAKHIRNVRSGGWGEYGEAILKGGECALETWAITHILTYERNPVFSYAGNKYHPLYRLDFDYRNKFDRVLNAFQEKYDKSYYDCI